MFMRLHQNQNELDFFHTPFLNSDLPLAIGTLVLNNTQKFHVRSNLCKVNLLILL